MKATAFLFFWLMGVISSPGQTRVEDIFGRSINQRGLTLVDWEGYMANPLIQFFVLPPTNAVLPGMATLAADGARLYFDAPSDVSPHGPSKTISLSDTRARVPVRISIFPDRDGRDEDYALKVIFSGADGMKQTNEMPIHVVDQDVPRTNEFKITLNFECDQMDFFTNLLARMLATQAADDWAYYFGGMNLDPVRAGTESTFIWSNNNEGGYDRNNLEDYRGYLLYAHGFTNRAYTSGGQGSYAGAIQTSQGLPLKIKRSGTFTAQTYGNYNTLGWLFLTNDADWLVTGNLGNQTNDFYTVAHHEIGHALIFDGAHPGFNVVQTNHAFTSALVTNYFGAPVRVDPVNHLREAIDPESGQGAFGHEYNGIVPRKRWLITKLDLLCAAEVGYALRDTSAFADPRIVTRTLPSGTRAHSYSVPLTASGGIPFYDWQVSAGALPPGLSLDRFTGLISGIPTASGRYQVTIRLRDYHEASAGVTRDFLLNVGEGTNF